MSIRVTLSHSGKQHSYHVAKALLDQNALDAFFTSSYIASPLLQKIILQRHNTFFMRRFQNGLAAPFVKANWGFELKEMYLRKRYGKGPKALNAVYERDTSFDNFMASKLASRKSEVFWGFQGSSHASLIEAKKLGKLAVCELSTAHVTSSIEILSQEAKLHPEWSDSFDNLVFPASYQKRLEEEPHIADLAIAASTFTKSTLLSAGVSADKIELVPLGFDVNYVPYMERNDDITTRPLKLLYAGTLTQRKGLKYLLNVMKKLNRQDIELTCIGGLQGSGAGLKGFDSCFTHIPAVAQHVMFEKYRNYDALVLPTIFEGFGLVIVEAMAAGLPVITTPHSMGPEVIKQDKNGYIIPIRDETALETAILNLRNKDKYEYLAMRQAARNDVMAYTWDAYSARMPKVLENLEQRFRNLKLNV